MPRTGRQALVNEYECRTCGTKFWGKIKQINGKSHEMTPKNCPECKSPYWNQKYSKGDKRR